ncbi:hypothetical protein ABZ477_17355 [Microbacterium sp. NPDC019599]|uniref:hypothetical protein n=1 Tax=Microbacterium sp. NPDC019599 TaxID=3154690 RepID=UPI0034071534
MPRAHLTRRSASRHAAVTVAALLVLGLTGCAAPQPPATGADAAELELIGMHGFAFEDFALDLRDAGYQVSDDGVLSPTTDLVLLVVNAQDGPMVPTREAVAALAGSIVPRAAIALVDVDEQTDPELEALVVQESLMLLAEYGITPVDRGNVVRSPGTDIASTIEVHLRRAPKDYPVQQPSP